MKKNKQAFTIIEILVILSVLGILIAIAIPRIKGMLDSGNIAKVKGELQTLQTAVESYYALHKPSVYPYYLAGSNYTQTGPCVSGGFVVFNVDSTSGSTLTSSLMTEAPQIVTSQLTDPFKTGMDYQYILSLNLKYYVISSYGPDTYGNSSCSQSRNLPVIGNDGVVFKAGDDICVTNGTGC
ncbi:MAG: prepilin-type N-terminal cleavage/methylation domain-containing protein [Candidatus Omnitrophota bacterium]